MTTFASFATKETVSKKPSFTALKPAFSAILATDNA